MAVIMATICFAAGTAISAGLKMRVLQLEKFIAMLNEMEILIRFRAVRTYEIIAELSNQDSFRNFIFLNILNEYIEDETIDINEGWRNAAKNAIFFTESDKRILLNVGEQIGSTDIDGQLSMININKTLAQRNLSEAEADYRTKGKMLKTVWGLCGLAAGIMIV